MKKILVSMIAMTVVLVSCNNSDSTDVDKSLLPPASATPAVNAIKADTAQALQVVNAATPLQTTVSPAPAQSAVAAKNTGNAALNPAHGQPGHRCDIAVGAPLNTPVSKTAAPAVTTAPATVTATPPAAATPVSTDPNVKLNPAHGQPGHDCSIAVGAPLKKN